MADFYQSSLFNPTAPREILLRHIKRKPSKCNTAHIIPSDEIEGKPNQAKVFFLNRLFKYFNIHLKKYSTLQNPNNFHNQSSCSETDREIAGHSELIKNSLDLGCGSLEEMATDDKCQNIQKVKSKPKRKKTKTAKFSLLFRIYLAIRNKSLKQGADSDIEHLVEEESEISEILPVKKKRKKRQIKNFTKKRKKACRKAYSNSKKVLSKKRKKVQKRFKKGCLNWAYGVMNMSSAFPHVYAPAGISSVNQFHCDFSYISGDPYRYYCQ